MEWLDWLGLIVTITWVALMTDWLLTRQAERAQKMMEGMDNDR